MPYKRVMINGKSYKLHRLVWELINGPIPDGHDIHHIDGDKQNNHPSNLECIESREHLRVHRQQDGLKPPLQSGLKRTLHPIVCAHCGVSALAPHNGLYCSKECRDTVANDLRRTRRQHA